SPSEARHRCNNWHNNGGYYQCCNENWYNEQTYFSQNWYDEQTDFEQYRPYRPYRPHTVRNLNGWNVPPREAKRANNCYRYKLKVQGGKGSARIQSIRDGNYIQLDNGKQKGFVCFNGPTTLELGKLANPGTRVELKLEDYGRFVFQEGSRGQSFKNNWYRTYWNL
ncbi:MAG: hypothetical protein CR992_00675, partial [Desulfobacterales bacterium]